MAIETTGEEVQVTVEDNPVVVEVATQGSPGPPGSPGEKGEDGYTPAHEWNETQIRFQNSDGSWGDWTDLKGATGEQGLPGVPGADGATGLAPEHEWSGTQLRFRNPDGSWGSYVDLQGEQGEKGEDSTVPGPPGEQGVPGPNQVSTSTDTDIVGLLKGSAGKVAQAVAGSDYLASPTSIYGYRAVKSYFCNHNIYPNSAGNPVKDRLWVTPFVVSDPSNAFDRIAIYRASSAYSAGAVARLGIYNDGGLGLPTSLILDSGTVALDGTAGLREIIINQVLNRGRYWLAFVCTYDTAGTVDTYGRSGAIIDLGNRAISQVHNGYNSPGLYVAFPYAVLPANFSGNPVYPDNIADLCPRIFLRRAA